MEICRSWQFNHGCTGLTQVFDPAFGIIHHDMFLRSSDKILLLLIASAMLVIGCSRLPAEYQNVQADKGEIRIPLGQVSDGKAHFFTYKHSGKRINFFVRTDRNGALSASYDACFTCYKQKKGYRQDGSDLICNECRMKFGLADEKWDNSQGCSPILLKSRISEDVMIINTLDIEKGGKLF